VSLTAHDPLRMRSTVIGGTIDPEQAQASAPATIDPPSDAEPRVDDDDTIMVTCAACDTRQPASGRATGYTCRTCGSDWAVLRCRGCRQASVVLDGTTDCPRCGHENLARARPAGVLPSWLTEPTPLSIWLGGAKYLGGHAERDQPVAAAGLLLDRRGFHVRAFAELFTIPWSTVRSVKIEGPADISERITMSRLVGLGASTWVTSVSYLTLHTDRGDAIFEIHGLSAPELRARLSRVLQGLEPSASTSTVTLDSGTPTRAPEPTAAVAPPIETAPAPRPLAVTPEANGPTALAIDPATVDAPLEVLVVDALWKLAQLRDAGLLHPDEIAVLRAQLLARVSNAGVTAGPDGPVDGGPLLHV
jgi:predicted RNA-binding Zn-ribbon protein involved in translation (DUF1610 family)